MTTMETGVTYYYSNVVNGKENNIWIMSVPTTQNSDTSAVSFSYRLILIDSTSAGSNNNKNL